MRYTTANLIGLQADLKMARTRGGGLIPTRGGGSSMRGQGRGLVPTRGGGAGSAGRSRATHVVGDGHGRKTVRATAARPSKRARQLAAAQLRKPRRFRPGSK